jgi:ribosomal protein S18 acetylase RimI-like enzyme
MSEALQDLSATAMVRAIEENLFAFFALFRHWPRALVGTEANMQWTLTDIPFGFFNSVLHAQLTPDTLDAAIETAVARCRSRDVPMFWFTGPATRPTDLGAHLEAHGFTHRADRAGMAVDLRQTTEEWPRPPELAIEHVGDGQALEEWGHAFALGYGAPGFIADGFVDLFGSCGLSGESPFRHYVGRMQGEPVATSSLYLGAGVAGIYNVATAPEARRQGIGAAMTLAPLREARAMGYQVGVLEASPMGVNVYRRLGFQEYCKLGMYVWSPKKT